MVYVHIHHFDTYRDKYTFAEMIGQKSSIALLSLTLNLIDRPIHPNVYAIGQNVRCQTGTIIAGYVCKWVQYKMQLPYSAKFS